MNAVSVVKGIVRAGSRARSINELILLGMVCSPLPLKIRDADVVIDVCVCRVESRSERQDNC